MNKDSISQETKDIVEKTKLLEEARGLPEKYGLYHKDGNEKKVTKEDFLNLFGELRRILDRAKELNFDFNSTKETPIYKDAGSFCFVDNYKGAYDLLMKELKKDSNAHVHMSLGDIYYYGIGVEKNIELAHNYYQEAINNHETEESLADILGDYYYVRAMDYQYGTIVEKNIQMALEYYEKAFRYGYIEAYINIGCIYHDGDLVPKDDGKAIEYFEKAAMQGALDEEYKPSFDKVNTGIAFNNAGFLYAKDNDPKAIENLKALEYFKKSAALDNNTGLYHIGYMNHYGLGVEKNLDEAIKWYKLAADDGNKDAEGVLEKLNIKSK